MEAMLEYYKRLNMMAKLNNGFTVDSKGNSPKSGYVVSIPDYEMTVKREMLDETIIASYMSRVETVVSNKFKKYFVGCWYNETDSKYYLDVNLVLTDVNKAIEVGRKNKQIAIFDLDLMSEIRL